MIELRDDLIFAEGGRRVCFVHPDDPGKCVKTLSENGDPVRRRRAAVWYKRLRPLAMFDDNRRELDSFRELQTKGDEVWRHFPRCYGLLPTSRGDGIVCDLIRDESGEVSRSLRQVVNDDGKTPELARALEEFFSLLRERIVLTRDLLDHNLLVQTSGNGALRVYMIDGFGSSELIPVSKLFPRVGKRKVERKILRFRQRYGF